MELAESNSVESIRLKFAEILNSFAIMVKIDEINQVYLEGLLKMNKLDFMNRIFKN
jgi:hypothetical protein